jgi:hypothetical protein
MRPRALRRNSRYKSIYLNNAKSETLLPTIWNIVNILPNYSKRTPSANAFNPSSPLGKMRGWSLLKVFTSVQNQPCTKTGHEREWVHRRGGLGRPVLRALFRSVSDYRSGTMLTRRGRPTLTEAFADRGLGLGLIGIYNNRSPPSLPLVFLALLLGEPIQVVHAKAERP